MYIHPSITRARVIQAAERYNVMADMPGFCTACGADTDGCEPNDERLVCETCGETAVYAAPLLLMIAMPD